MSKLFSELTVGGVTFKNRAWVSPMCQYSAVEGVIQDWHAVHYGSLITGGAGLVMVEASAVSPEGRITPRCAGIWTDQQAQVWAEVPRFAQRFGVKTGIQLAHAGRKATRKVRLKANDREIKIVVTDDGVGFRPSRVPKNRLGLRISIIDRVEAIGGRVFIDTRIGQGTSIILEWDVR